MRAKWERAVTRWKPAVQMRPVLYSSSFVPVPMLTPPPQTYLHSASSVLAVRISCRLIAVFCVQKATKRIEKSVNTHNRLRYSLTNKIFFLQAMYRCVRMIFIVKCVTVTGFFIAYAALWWKSMIFIVLSSLDTVHDTVQYRYCIFSLLYLLLMIRINSQNPLLS